MPGMPRAFAPTLGRTRGVTCGMGQGRCSARRSFRALVRVQRPLSPATESPGAAWPMPQGGGGARTQREYLPRAAGAAGGISGGVMSTALISLHFG